MSSDEQYDAELITRAVVDREVRVQNGTLWFGMPWRVDTARWDMILILGVRFRGMDWIPAIEYGNGQKGYGLVKNIFQLEKCHA